jgi:hypothetical protein
MLVGLCALVAGDHDCQPSSALCPAGSQQLCGAGVGLGQGCWGACACRSGGRTDDVRSARTAAVATCMQTALSPRLLHTRASAQLCYAWVMCRLRRGTAPATQCSACATVARPYLGRGRGRAPVHPSLPPALAPCSPWQRRGGMFLHTEDLQLCLRCMHGCWDVAQCCHCHTHSCCNDGWPASTRCSSMRQQEQD